MGEQQNAKTVDPARSFAYGRSGAANLDHGGKVEKRNCAKTIGMDESAIIATGAHCTNCCGRGKSSERSLSGNGLTRTSNTTECNSGLGSHASIQFSRYQDGI